MAYPIDPDDPRAVKAREEWHRSPALQAEFLTADNYASYKLANDAGLIKTLTSQEVRRGNA